MNWTSRIAATISVAVLMIAAGCDSALAPAGDEATAMQDVASKNPLMYVPDEFPGYPWYHNALNPVPLANPYHGYPDWIPVLFYHPLDCLPEGLDLLDVSPHLESLACPSTVEGFFIWPESEPGPTHQVMQAAMDVPFWFVSLEDWYDAADDGHVWVDEFQALPSFREGYATFLQRSSRLQGSKMEAHGVVTSEPDMTFKMRFVAQFVRDENGALIQENIPVFEVDFK